MHENKGRSENIMFFVTPSEKEEIREKAFRARKTISGYLRSLALKKEEKEMEE